jgi:hypothetical protein
MSGTYKVGCLLASYLKLPTTLLLPGDIIIFVSLRILRENYWGVYPLSYSAEWSWLTSKLIIHKSFNEHTQRARYHGLTSSELTKET